MPKTAPGKETPAMDLKKSLLETFAINDQANQLLLKHVTEEAWEEPPPSGKGRSIGAIAAHMHNVRLMWLSAADKKGKHPAKLDPEKATRSQAQASLKASATALAALLEKALEDPEGRVPNFKPNAVAFAGYLIAHDSHHRGQMALLAKQAGHPLPKEIGFGLWQWGTLWRECGFGGGSSK
jgi:uncharacterized damage-inducible protein DinB